MLAKPKDTNKYIENWEEVFGSLGYKIERVGTSIRTQGVYRGGASNSIELFPESQTYRDYKTHTSGSFYHLIQLTTGAEDLEIREALQYVVKNPHSSFKRAIDVPPTFSEKSIDSFKYDYSYFEGRGISKKVQQLYEGGMIYKEKYSFRFTFPIRSESLNDKIIGFCGRYVKPINNENFPKWLIIGWKRFFVYNYKLCLPAIQKERSVILVESIGDSLSFAQAGIFNTLTLFGTELSKALKIFLIKQNPNRIIISTNNDSNGAGQLGAAKIQNSLSKIFSGDKVLIRFPEQTGDWNEMLVKNGEGYIRDFYKGVML